VQWLFFEREDYPGQRKRQIETMRTADTFFPRLSERTAYSGRHALTDRARWRWPGPKDRGCGIVIGTESRWLTSLEEKIKLKEKLRFSARLFVSQIQTTVTRSRFTSRA